MANTIMEPILPRTQPKDGGVLLVLDNGVRLESRGGPDGADYILLADAKGVQIGYWLAVQWAEEPKKIMGQILLTAARGYPS